MHQLLKIHAYSDQTGATPLVISILSAEQSGPAVVIQDQRDVCLNKLAHTKKAAALLLNLWLIRHDGCLSVPVNCVSQRMITQQPDKS